jgi:sugar-specific transcriptional regulator TrmB
LRGDFADPVGMALQRNGDRTPRRPLDAIGIGKDEEQVYLCLLEHPRATVAELAGAAQLSPRRVQHLLDLIESKGLVTHTPQRPRQYILAAPEIAMEALILDREKELQHARGMMKDLHERAARHQQRVPKPMIELITNRDAASQVFNQLQATAQGEVLFLVRPPFLISSGPAPPPKADNITDARERGVRYRGVVDSEYLALPGAVEHVRADVRAGDAVRVVPKLPFKMVLADRRIALIPLDLESSSSEVLVVRSSALLDALYALFEKLWDGAVPISLSRRGLETGGAPPRLPPGHEELLQLMAAGLNDKAIAHELGLSIRTLNRRILELTRSLNAKTRFQIGWRAARLVDGDETRPAREG